MYTQGWANFIRLDTKDPYEEKLPVRTKLVTDALFKVAAKEEVKEPKDAVEYFNQKHYTKEELSKIKPINGSFYKVRAQGGATARDIEQINKFYKRALMTMGLLMAHSYLAVTFLYESRFITERNKKLFQYFPFCLYPGVLVVACIVMYRQNRALMRNMDGKYTPLWLEISKKL